jgi:tetratricopeptide (TPR) repeat protein
MADSAPAGRTTSPLWLTAVLSHALAFLLGVLGGMLVPRPSAEPAGEPEAARPEAGQNQSAPDQGEGAARDESDAASRVTALRAAVEQRPEEPQVHVRFGNALFDAQKPREAIEAYTRALELGPKQPDVLVDRGICYRRIGEPRKAVADFRAAIDKAPDHVNAHFNLGVVALHDLGDRARARRAWQRYLELAGDTRRAKQIRRALRRMAQDEKGGRAPARKRNEGASDEEGPSVREMLESES